METRKYFELLDNESVALHKFWDIAKAIRRGKFISLKCLYCIAEKAVIK